MAKPYNRTPFGYDGSRTTTRTLQDLLPGVVGDLQVKYEIKPDEVLQAWPKVAGSVASMTQAVRFEDGILHVKVHNSTLLSLLANPSDKKKLIDALQHRVPHVIIRNILFRIG